MGAAAPLSSEAFNRTRLAGSFGEKLLQSLLRMGRLIDREEEPERFGIAVDGEHETVGGGLDFKRSGDVDNGIGHARFSSLPPALSSVGSNPDFNPCCDFGDVNQCPFSAVNLHGFRVRIQRVRAPICSPGSIPRGGP